MLSLQVAELQKFSHLPLTLVRLQWHAVPSLKSMLLAVVKVGTVVAWRLKFEEKRALCYWGMELLIRCLGADARCVVFYQRSLCQG